MGHDDKKNDNSDSKISETIKKIVSTGIGAAFMTEESIRSILSDIQLPKDIIAGLVQNANSAKEDFLKSVREEVKNQIIKVDPKHLIDELVKDYDIEVNAKISFTKKKKQEESPEKGPGDE
jgi:hypothetical protein